MECKFCNQQLALHMLTPLLGHSFCYTCQAEYSFYNRSENIFGTHLYTKINEKLYRLSKYGVFFHLYYIKTPGIPGHTVNQGVEKVVSLKEDPNATPQNIQSKVRTILTFL